MVTSQSNVRPVTDGQIIKELMKPRPALLQSGGVPLMHELPRSAPALLQSGGVPAPAGGVPRD